MEGNNLGYEKWLQLKFKMETMNSEFHLPEGCCKLSSAVWFLNVHADIGFQEKYTNLAFVWGLFNYVVITFIQS